MIYDLMYDEAAGSLRMPDVDGQNGTAVEVATDDDDDVTHEKLVEARCKATGHKFYPHAAKEADWRRVEKLLKAEAKKRARQASCKRKNPSPTPEPSAQSLTAADKKPAELVVVPVMTQQMNKRLKIENDVMKQELEAMENVSSEHEQAFLHERQCYSNLMKNMGDYLDDHDKVEARAKEADEKIVSLTKETEETKAQLVSSRNAGKMYRNENITLNEEVTYLVKNELAIEERNKVQRQTLLTKLAQAKKAEKSARNEVTEVWDQCKLARGDCVALRTQVKKLKQQLINLAGLAVPDSADALAE